MNSFPHRMIPALAAALGLACGAASGAFAQKLEGRIVSVGSDCTTVRLRSAGGTKEIKILGAQKPPADCVDFGRRCISAIVQNINVEAAPAPGAPDGTQPYVLRNMSGEVLNSAIVLAGCVKADPAAGNDFATLEDTARTSDLGIWSILSGREKSKKAQAAAPAANETPKKTAEMKKAKPKPAPGLFAAKHKPETRPAAPPPAPVNPPKAARPQAVAAPPKAPPQAAVEPAPQFFGEPQAANATYRENAAEKPKKKKGFFSFFSSGEDETPAAPATLEPRQSDADLISGISASVRPARAPSRDAAAQDDETDAALTAGISGARPATGDAASSSGDAELDGLLGGITGFSSAPAGGESYETDGGYADEAPGDIFDRAKELEEGSEESEPDFKEAAQLYKTAADKNHAQSALAYARLLEAGKGAAKNDAEAAKYYRKAAKAGNPAAAYRLGLLYEEGRGVKKDFVQAARFYEAAAAKKIPGAARRAGSIYAAGKTGAVDYPKAIRFYAQAGREDAAVQYEIYRLCQKVQVSSAPECENPLRWLELAAKKGSPQVLYALGREYYKGGQTKRNYQLAYKFLIAAARKGSAHAQYLVGLMNEKGLGVPKNLIEAASWYTLAGERPRDTLVKP